MKTQRIHIYHSLFVLVALIFYVPAIGQKSFGFESTYVTGFQDNQIKILDECINISMPHGIQFSVLYGKRIKETPWRMTMGLGGKHMSIEGTTSSQLKFTANSFKANALLGVHYKVHKNFDLGFQCIVESNRDLEEIFYLKTDIFRFYLSFETVYAINNKWGAVIKYGRSISSNDDLFLLFTPINQISIGLNFYFHEI